MNNNKIILFLIGVTLSVSGVLMFVLFRNDLNLSGSSAMTASLLDKFSGSTPKPSYSTASSGHSTRLSQKPAVSAVFSLDKKKVLYYEKNTGRALSIGLTGSNEEILSDQPLANFVRSVWSPSRQDVISTFSTSRGSQMKEYNYTSKKVTPLDSHITSAVFSPDGTLLAYFLPDPDGGGVYLSDILGNNPKKILSTRSVNMQVSWIDPQTIALLAAGSAPTTKGLFVITPQGDLTRIIDFKKGLETNWSLDGSKILFSFFDDQGNLVTGIYDRTTESSEKTPRAVFASQCAWGTSTTFLVCGIPSNSETISSSATEYSVQENIIGMDLTTKATEVWYTPQGNQTFNVQQILLSPLEDTAIIINGVDEQLWSIKK